MNLLPGCLVKFNIRRAGDIFYCHKAVWNQLGDLELKIKHCHVKELALVISNKFNEEECRVLKFHGYFDRDEEIFGLLLGEDKIYLYGSVLEAL